MTSLPFLILGFVALAAGGSAARAVVISAVNREFYYGTLLINLVGSLLLGMLAGSTSPWAPVLGIAGLGALTTWSTLANEVTTLLRQGDTTLAGSYLAASALGGVAAAWIGLQIGPII